MPTPHTLRISAILGVAATAGLGISAASTAHADPTGGPHFTAPAFGADSEQTNCTVDLDDIQYLNPDSGKWVAANIGTRLIAEPADGQIKIRIYDDGDQPAGPGCTRTVSLADYTTGGATWQTSALQAFAGSDSATLDSSHPTATLTVPLPGTTASGHPCWGQLDLYLGATVYDGKHAPGHGPLPHYPDTVTPSSLLATWNGGEGQCRTITPPTTAPSTPVTRHSSPPTSPSTTPRTTPSTPIPSTPSPTHPAGSPSLPPSTSAPKPPPGELAHTGSDAGILAAGAAGFIVLGAATLYGTRRMGRRH
jgi:hypothetical protein